MHSSLLLDIRLLSYSIVRNPWSLLIPLSCGSFDVIVGMDWLSKKKFVIVCHEKVVRIPLEGDEILRVHGERTQGVVKTLMNTKVDEPKLSDISVSKEEHEVHLKLVLESLRKENLYDKFSKSNVVGDALSRKEKVKSRRVRGMILAAQSEAFKQENVLIERLHGFNQQMERKGDESLYFMDQIWVLLVGSVMDEAHASRYLEWNSGDDQLRLRWMIYLVVLADAAESVRDAIGFEYCLASSSEWTKSPVLWAEIRESSLTRLYDVDYRRKPLEFEVGDRVLLKVTPWKGVVRFGKKGKLAPRYVKPFEILERNGLVAYRLRLHTKLNSVHDTICNISHFQKLSHLGTIAPFEPWPPPREEESSYTLSLKPPSIPDLPQIQISIATLRHHITLLPSQNNFYLFLIILNETRQQEKANMIGPELVQKTTDKVVLIKEKIKATRDRKKKSYADNRRKPLELEVGYIRLLVDLKAPLNVLLRFG
ncbi:hypothetical protein Tco_1002453 [Tanacetum coccineum]|uniref:Tf2-1-like SH3-like domain-containing protein n=1 Tax=Tanacetum coccineum TaxID=301880 RepID=A0ABQ5F7M9_9ASTR